MKKFGAAISFNAVSRRVSLIVTFGSSVAATTSDRLFGAITTIVPRRRKRLNSFERSMGRPLCSTSTRHNLYKGFVERATARVELPVSDHAALLGFHVFQRRTDAAGRPRRSRRAGSTGIV